MEAYNQIQELQVELSSLALDTVDDSWTYIWGSTQFSSKAYRILTGHSQVDTILNGFGRLHVKANIKYFSGWYSKTD